MKKNKLILLLGIVVVSSFLTGCLYQNPHNGFSYLLHTEYDLFTFNSDPNLNPSNFIGFCTLPMEDDEDPKAIQLIALFEHFLKQHGYYKLSKEELIANYDLLDNTFMLSIGFSESFTYESIQLDVTFFKYDIKRKKNNEFWSWKAKFDGYPVCREVIEPVLKDVFELEPLEYGETEVIFPKMSANSAHVADFLRELNEARSNIMEQAQ